MEEPDENYGPSLQKDALAHLTHPLKPINRPEVMNADRQFRAVLLNPFPPHGVRRDGDIFTARWAKSRRVWGQLYRA